MGKNQTIIINADVIATLKGMDKVVTGLKSGLSEANTKIDFTKGIGASVSKLVDKFKNEFSKFNQLTENGKLDIGNTKEALKSGKNLIDTYKELQRIIGDLNSLTVIDAKKLFPDAFDQRVENASKKLKDFSNNWNRISEKQLKLDQAKTELQVLTDKLKELEKSLIDTNTLKVNTTSADQKVEEMTNKVKELKNEFKKELKLKVDTTDKDLIKNKRNRDNLQEKLNRANSSGNINTAGRSVRYKGATLSEWEKGIGKASNASSQQKAGAIKALQNYSNITKELDAVNKKIKEQEKELENLKTGWASFDNITDEKLGKELAKMGFSTDEIAQIQKAINDTNVAISEQTNARQKLAEAETENARIEKEMSKTNSGITQKTQEIKQLEQAVENLQTKVGVEGLKKALKDALDIDISDDLLKSEQGLESLKNQLNELDNKSLSELIEKLSDMGINTEQAKQYVEQLTGTMVELGDSAKDINRANQEMEQLKNQVLQFFSIGNAVQLFKRAVKSAFDTVKELDATMTETAVVTDFSVSDMWKQLPTYTAEANKLGAAINDLYGSTTLYYQQGLQTKAAMALGIETTKMARIANIEAADATNLMTAALRGFNMELNETSAQKVNDIYSELAAITAADTQEIGVAMSKTASIASSANMELETTAALLSQIIETTREAPETAGTAMKTIIARFSEVKELVSQGQLTGEDTEGEIIDVNKIQGALRSVGISMKEFFAGTEGLDDVLLKLASKWDTLDFTTQRYIATTAAGSRQQSRFIAMMSDYGRTQELVSAAYNSAGASQEQFEKTLDSLEAKLTKLKNAWDQFAMGLANNEFIKGAIDVLTGLLNTINSIIDGISGGSGLAKSVLSLGFAFSAFKLGKNFLGQIGAKLRMALGTGTEKDAKIAGQSMAQNIGVGLGEGIKKIKKGELGKALLEKIGITKGRAIKGKDLTKAFGLDQLSNLDLGTKNAGNKLKASLFKQFKSLPDDIKGEMSNLDFGKILMNSSDLDSLKNAIPPEISKNLKMIGQDAKNAGGQLNKFSGNFKTVAAVASTAGLALQGIASIMEEMGASEEAVNIVRTLGGVLMALGPIITLVGSIITAMGQVATATFTEMAIAAWNSLGPWGYIILAIVAVTAAFVALAAAIAATGQEAQIKKINEQISALSDEAQEARDAIDEISKTKSGLEELQDTFANLTKGTTEWKQTLVEINQQVLDLIAKYPQLSQYITKTRFGSLDIKDEGWDAIIQGQENKLNASLIAQTSLQSKAAGLQQEIDYEKFFSTNAKKQTKEFTKNNSALIGGISGTLLGPLGLISGSAGAAIGKAAEDSFSELTSSIAEWGTQAFLDIADFADTGWGKAIFGALSVGGGLFGTALGIANGTRTTSIGDLAERATTGGLTHDEYANYAAALAEAGLTNTGGYMNKDEARKIYTDMGFDPTVFDEVFGKIKNLGESFDELSASALATSIAEEAREQAMLETMASNSEELLASDFSQQAQSFISSQKDIQGEIDKEIENMGKMNEEMKQQYADITGQTLDQVNAQLKEESLSEDTIKQTIASYNVSESITKKMENLASRLDQINEEGIADQIAAIVSGDGTGLAVNQIENLSNLSMDEIASTLGYKDVDSMASDFDYTQKTLSELDTEDKGAALRKLVEGGFVQLKEGETFDTLSDERYQQLMNENAGAKIGANWQIEIDFEANQQKLEEEKNKVIESLINNTDLTKTDISSLVGSYDLNVVKGLAEQTSQMGKEAGTKYIESFNKAVGNDNDLATYLSSIDISSMTDMLDAMDYMQEQGVDPTTIQEYWDIATNGANTYISSLDEVLALTERMQKKMASVNDIASRLEEGSASYEDMMELVKAGADISDFQLTSEGWKATGEQIAVATDKMKEYNAQQARSMADQQQEAWDRAKNNKFDFITKNADGTWNLLNGGIGQFTSVSDDGKTLRAGTVNADNAATIAKAIGLDESLQTKAETETLDEYLARIQEAYNSYISLLNNGEDLQIIANKQAAMAEAARYTAAENEARGGSAESIIYSAQNEATEAGLDANAMMQYADTLRQVHTELDEVTAVQVALANSKMNAGLGEIIDSYDEWSAVIDKDTGKLKDFSAEGVATYNKLKASVNKMLNTSEDLSNAFWDNAENMKNIEKAAKGDTKALGELQKAAAKDFLINLDAENLSDTAENAINDFLDYYNNIEIPPMEPGVNMSEVWSGAEEFKSAFNQMVQDANLSAEQIQKAAQNMGFDANITYVEQTRRLPLYSQTETRTENADGTATITSGPPVITDYADVTGYFPVVETFTPTGNGGGGISVNNKKAGSAKSGGGGGGGGSKEDTKTWKNPYDEYYNTTEKINELLRDRNKLEREYDRLLSRNSTTVEQLNKNLEKQLKNLEDQIKSQKVLLSGKRRQLINAKNATMEVAEGRAISFQQKYQEAGGTGDISQYAYYDENLGQVVINWDKLEALQAQDAEQGEAVEAYISYLEGIAGDFEDAQDALSDIEDSITEIINQQLEERVDFIETMRDLLVEQYQKRIDELSSLNDTINDSNQKILDGISESIELERQILVNDITIVHDIIIHTVHNTSYA